MTVKVEDRVNGKVRRVDVTKVARPGNRLSFRYKDGNRVYVTARGMNKNSLRAEDTRKSWDTGSPVYRNFDVGNISDIALIRGDLS